MVVRPQVSSFSVWVVDWMFHHEIPSELHRYLWHDLENGASLGLYSIDLVLTHMLVVCQRVSSIDGRRCMFRDLEERIVEEIFSRWFSAWREVHQAWAPLRLPSDVYRQWSSLPPEFVCDCNSEQKKSAQFICRCSVHITFTRTSSTDDNVEFSSLSLFFKILQGWQKIYSAALLLKSPSPMLM